MTQIMGFQNTVINFFKHTHTHSSFVIYSAGQNLSPLLLLMYDPNWERIIGLCSVASKISTSRQEIRIFKKMNSFGSCRVMVNHQKLKITGKLQITNMCLQKTPDCPTWTTGRSECKLYFGSQCLEPLNREHARKQPRLINRDQTNTKANTKQTPNTGFSFLFAHLQRLSCLNNHKNKKVYK